MPDRCGCVHWRLHRHRHRRRMRTTMATREAAHWRIREITTMVAAAWNLLCCSLGWRLHPTTPARLLLAFHLPGTTHMHTGLCSPGDVALFRSSCIQPDRGRRGSGLEPLDGGGRAGEYGDFDLMKCLKSADLAACVCVRVC
jgi:hypothetical protein